MEKSGAMELFFFSPFPCHFQVGVSVETSHVLVPLYCSYD